MKRYVAYVMLFTRRDLSLENTGYMGFIFDWISCANVYLVLVCEHPYELSNLYPDGCCFVVFFG